MPICKYCGKPLNQSQYNEDESYKSCPRCSKIDGEEHIYFPYPGCFGDTPKRSSDKHPDGPQSYCYVHRGNPHRSIPSDGIPCHNIK